MSANQTNASLPSPEPEDPSDVSVALEAARALWENGDTDEALRWFSRAVEAAEQSGNDRRALDLARAVAELKDGLSAKSGPPAPSAPTTKSVTRPPPPSARRSLPPIPPSMRPKPPPEPPKPKASDRELLPYEKPPSTPPVVTSALLATAEAPAAPPATPATSKAPPPTPAAATPAAPPAAPATSKAPPPTPAAPATPAATKSDASERLRVSVKSSVRDPELFLVRVLKNGQPVPAGCREAFLAPAQPGVDLRSLPE